MKKEKEKKRKRDKAVVAAKDTDESLPTFSMERPPVPEKAVTPDSMMYLRQVLDQLGGKWRLQVLWSLRDGEGLRYGSIKSSIPGITDMMLSQSLRELCQTGLVERRQFQEIPPRVEYRILQQGSTLLPVIRWLIDWQRNRMAEQPPQG